MCVNIRGVKKTEKSRKLKKIIKKSNCENKSIKILKN
jgi:hypothetical protein